MKERRVRPTISLKTAAASRPKTKMRVTHPSYKINVNPELSRSVRSGLGTANAQWRRELKNAKFIASVKAMKEEYLATKMESKFKEAMQAKKRRQSLQEAKERLQSRNMHVATLLKQNKLAAERKAREECASRHKKRTEESFQHEAMSARSKLLEARRQSRINEGLPADLSPHANLRCTPTKLSVRRATIRRLLRKHNPRAIEPHNFEKLLKKWKGRERQLLKNIREKYGEPSPAKNSKSPANSATALSSAHLLMTPPENKLSQHSTQPEPERGNLRKKSDIWKPPTETASDASLNSGKHEPQSTHKQTDLETVSTTYDVPAETEAKNEEQVAADIYDAKIDSNKESDAAAKTDVAETDVAGDGVAETDVAEDEVAETDVAENEVANTDVAKTDVAEDEVAETDVAEDELAEADVAENELAETDVAEDELAETDVAENEVAETDVAEDELAETDVAENELAETDVADTDVAENEVAETDVAENEVAETDVAEGEVAETDVADTDVAEDEVAETDVAESEVAETDVAETDVAEDEVAETDVAENEVAETDVAEDEVAETDVAEDNLAETDVAENELAETDVAEDEVAETDVAETDVAEDELAETDVAEEKLAETDVAEGEVAETDVAEDEVAETDVADTDVAGEAITTDVDLGLNEEATADVDEDPRKWRWYYQEPDVGRTRWQEVRHAHWEALSERYRSVVEPSMKASDQQSSGASKLWFRIDDNGYAKFRQDWAPSLKAVSLGDDTFASPTVGMYFQLPKDTSCDLGLYDQLGKGTCLCRLHRFQILSRPLAPPALLLSLQQILLRGTLSPRSALRIVHKHTHLVLRRVLEFLPPCPKPRPPYQAMHIDPGLAKSWLNHNRPSFTVVGRQVAFPKPTGIKVEMMPINLEDVPDFLSGYQNIISTCARLLRGHNGKGCFLTVHENIVPAGYTQRRAGLHTEPSGGAFAGAGDHVLPSPRFDSESSGLGHRQEGNFQSGIFFCSNVARTEIIYDCEVRAEAIDKCVCADGSVEHLRGTLHTGFALDAGDLIWLTDRTPHECVAVDQEVYRQWFKLAVAPVSVWNEGEHASSVGGLEAYGKTPPDSKVPGSATGGVRAMEETRRMTQEDRHTSETPMQLSWSEWFETQPQV